MSDGTVYGALGVHPLNAGMMDLYTVNEIRKCFKDEDMVVTVGDNQVDVREKIVAVGECGLDFHR